MAAPFCSHTAALLSAARGVLLALLCLLAASGVGCAEKRPGTDLPGLEGGAGDTRARAETLLARDPAGTVPAPNLPPQLKAAAPPSVPASAGSVPYTVEYTSPDAPELAESLGKTATLSRLVDSPPDSLTGLEQRLAASLDEARDILRSHGYYAGSVEGRIDPPASDADRSEGRNKAVARVIFTPGPRYTMGRTVVAAFHRDVSPAEEAAPGGKAPGGGKARPAASPEAGARTVQGPGLPAGLADVGLASGSPATADAVLDAVDRTVAAFRNNGYPFAKLDVARYIVDHNTRTLDADVRIDAGPFARMGDIRVQGDSPVTLGYLEALQTWTPGDPWNQEAVDTLSDSLRNSGLMRSISLTPAETADVRGRRDIVAVLEPTPPRTLSGALKYDSDFGFGVQGGWEHRNLTGRGDSLRLAMPLWMDLQELTAQYRLPYFLDKDQAFIAQAGLLNQNTDAYDLRSFAASAGVERRFSRYWTGSLQGADTSCWGFPRASPMTIPAAS